MTREEAKEILEEVKTMDDSMYQYNKAYLDALNMAIKALEQELKMLDTIDFAIDASNGDTNYFVGFRNGLRYTKSLVDGKDPQYEHCAQQEPILDKIRAEIEKQEKWLLQAGYNTYNVDIAFNSIKLALAESEDKE